MLDLTQLPPVKFRVTGDIEDEAPVELDMTTARVVMERATRSVDELIAVVRERQPTTTREPTENTGGQTNESAPSNSLSIEVSWDVADDQVPEKVQELVVLLVGSGIIMALKDILSDETLNERLAELARIRLEEDNGERTTLAEAAKQFDVPLEEL